MCFFYIYRIIYKVANIDQHDFLNSPLLFFVLACYNVFVIKRRKSQNSNHSKKEKRKWQKKKKYR